MRYRKSTYHSAWHTMSPNKWNRIQCFKSSFCPGRAEPTPGTWVSSSVSHQCHNQKQLSNCQTPFLWQQPRCHQPFFFTNFSGLIKNEFLLHYINFFFFFDRAISMRLTDQENAIDIVSLIPTKHSMKTFITYTMGSSMREKISGITAGCISTPKRLDE